MVKLASFLCVALSFATATVATPYKRTIAQIRADVAGISARITALDNAITAYPLSGGSLAGALNIHTQSAAIVTALDSATVNIIATGPHGDEDGALILADIQAFEPAILHSLVEIVKRRAAFAALPLGNVVLLVRQDLQKLGVSTGAFADSLIANTPTHLIPAAVEIKATVGDAITAAVAGYS